MANNVTTPTEIVEGERRRVKVRRKSEKEKYIRETVEAVVIALVLALLIRTFLVQAFKIPSSSMEDTLLIGDHILVNKSAYGLQLPRPAMIKVFGLTIPFFETELMPLWGGIERGDVVVFRFPGDREKDYIKRTVALAGDEVEFKDRTVYINGSPLTEPYAQYKGKVPSGFGEEEPFGPFTVPEGHIFVMGDNRDRSYDSRFWGPVKVSEVKGRAFIIYWSRDPRRSWPRGIKFERFTKGID